MSVLIALNTGEQQSFGELLGPAGLRVVLISQHPQKSTQVAASPCTQHRGKEGLDMRVDVPVGPSHPEDGGRGQSAEGCYHVCPDA